MAPIRTFGHELLPVSEGPQDGDRLFSFKELKEEEHLEDGSLGCFISSRSEGGILGKIYKRIKEQDSKIEKLDHQISEVKRNLHKVLLYQLKNEIVQLVNGLLHARVITLLGDIDIKTFRGKIILTF